MKKVLLSICLALAALGGAKAQETVYYGLSPAETPAASEVSAHGSGLNGFAEAAITLDPATDPAMQRLKGQQILGVRCYLRTAYAQKTQKRSYVMLSKNAPETIERQQYANFEAGWNDVYFDEPYTIGEDKLYLGFQVYETKGTPYPIVSFNSIDVPGGCSMNVSRKGWNDYSDRGVLLIQAILPAEAAPLLERSAYVRATSYPLTVEPSKEFNCEVYVHNLSNQPLSSLEISTQGAGDESPRTKTFSFDEPVAPFDGRMVHTAVFAGSTEGTSQPLTLKAERFNGEEVQSAAPGVSQLYVTHDAFTRIPLIEEFTGLTCPNCPFMSYYVDIAMEEYEGPVLYVAHHAGFQDDVFTQPVDKQLIYLFGPDYGPDYKYGYNPAIMYDRTILKGTTLPVYGASLPSEEPYLAAIREVASYPALAEVQVEADKTDDGAVEVRVHGRVHHDLVENGEKLYLSTYLVENNLSTEKYPQLGLDIDDAPADLLDRFRHNGVIRHNFCTEPTGDLLEASEDATFSVSYPAQQLGTDWVWDNCQVIAFVHRINKEDLSGNVVLNAGSNKLDRTPTSIDRATAETAPVKVFAGADRRLRANMPVESMEVYDLRGCRLDASTPQQPGVYVVSVKTAGGLRQAQKVVVR